MSAPGCCRHCEVGPNACAWRAPESIPPGVLGWTHHSIKATWDDGHCPACAVADLIDAESKTLSDGGAEGWKRVGMTLAANIARGES